MISLGIITLPDGFYFLQTGWWILHIAAITLAVMIGYLAGSRLKPHEVRQARGRRAHNMVQIPETFRFLNVGWWILHIIAIPLVFVLGGIFLQW